jgi:hypothetical protein
MKGGRKKAFCKSIRTTHNTTDLLEEYIKGSGADMLNLDAGPSSVSKRARMEDEE